MATMTALQTYTVGSTSTSVITFSSIPQTYTDLILKISARESESSQSSNHYIRVNNTSSPYIVSRFYGSGTSVGGDSLSGYIAVLPDSAATGTSNTFSNGEVYFYGYTSNNNKSVIADGVQENNTSGAYIYAEGGSVNSRNAITTITVTANDAFVQYSTFTLYGVYNSALETAVEAPTIGTATAGSQAADVAFTPAGSGAPASSYVVTSSPGGLTATGASSPIQIGGLTSGTAYTFTVRGQNPGGLGAASAASNSVTPYDGYESIATLYGAGASSITFSSIPSTYTHLQIRALVRTSNTSGVNWHALLRFNSDTGNNYTYHGLRGDGSSAISYGAANQSIGLTINSGDDANTALGWGVGVVDILDYANTNKNKTIRTLTGFDENGSGMIELISSLWMNTTAVSTITLSANSGTFLSNSVFELYGIR